MGLIKGLVDNLFLPKDQDEKLVQEFPNLYRARYTTDYALKWGFKVQPGWLPLVHTLSKKLEEEILKYPEGEREKYYATSVKQKFAGLCFYMAATTSEMDEMISRAELESFTVCEVCGKEGNFWPLQPKPMERIFTFCSAHQEIANRGRI